MSKKKLFSALCLILAAALVLPACSGGEKEPAVLTFTVPETFTSGSEGQFEVTVFGLTSRRMIYKPAIGIELNIQSTDGLYYLFGDTVWEEGLLQSGETERYGTVECEEDGEWVVCGSVFDGNNTGMTYMGYEFRVPPRVGGRFIRPYEAARNHQYMEVELNDTLPGRYRVHVAVREYSPKWGDDDIPFHPINGEDPLSFGGTTGEATDEIVFEFDIPKFDSDPIDVLGYTLYDESSTASEDGGARAAAHLDLLLHANGDIRYLQNDSVKFERPDGEGYSEVSDGVVYGLGGNDRYNYQYLQVCDEDGRDYSTPDVIPVGWIILQDWNRETTYRLSMTFAENEDGSGETYTLYLYLNFAETSE